MPACRVYSSVTPRLISVAACLRHFGFFIFDTEGMCGNPVSLLLRAGNTPQQCHHWRAMRHQAYMGPGADDGMGPGPTPRLDHFLPAFASMDHNLHQLMLGSWAIYPWSEIV